jgi:hypothetical protein
MIEKIMTGGIIDFVIAAPPTLAQEETRSINWRLFPVGETISLWLSDRPPAERIKGPFRKIYVELRDDLASPAASYSLGVCMAAMPASLAEVRRHSGDRAWVVHQVQAALNAIADQAHWRVSELDAFINNLAKQEMPLSHVFARLQKMHRPSRTACVPWISFRPSESTVGVRLTSPHGQREVVVHREQGPLWVNSILNDWGPLAKTAVKGTDFMLMDKNGNVLATVPITKAGATG